MIQLEKRETCHDCGVSIGEAHLDGCDCARCPECGGQRLTCFHHEDNQTPVIWTGYWPGEQECIEFGWACKWANHEWEQCEVNDPEARANLNRLYEDPSVEWSKSQQRFVKKQNPKTEEERIIYLS